MNVANVTLKVCPVLAQRVDPPPPQTPRASRGGARSCRPRGRLRLARRPGCVGVLAAGGGGHILLSFVSDFVVNEILVR